MLKRLLLTLVLLVPVNATAVYFPAGIDWTNPSQARFVQSLFLNMLGRAPSTQESQERVRSLRRNDNRTTRLRVFESLLASAEYRQAFESRGNWQIYRAPDYNYRNGTDSWRYEAAESAPDGFSELPGGNRFFTASVARSVAHYYSAYCYLGEPCIDNPELARERSQSPLASASIAHACADPANQTSQFKWVAINGTTYPLGIGSDVICMQDYYYQAEQLTLKRYDCDSGYINCERNSRQDLRATRSGTDTSGNASLFFRDGSRLALLNNDTNNANNTNVATTTNTDSALLGQIHECADNIKTSSRFLWQGPSRTAESVGIGSNTICMDNYYYLIEGLTLERYQCQRGFSDCQPDPQNNLTAKNRTRVNGKPGLLFDNGATVSLTERGTTVTRNNSTATTTNTTRNRTETTSQTRASNSNRDTGNRNSSNASTGRSSGTGTDCANPRARLSQFRWKSNGLSSWPDGVDGRIICLQDTYYEIASNKLRHYTCQANFNNCRPSPAGDLGISQISADGSVRTLSNGDEVTLVSQ